MIRKLTPADFTIFLNLTRAKLSSREIDFIDEANVQTLLNRDRNVVLGYFEGDELITALALRYGELHGECVWVISHFFTSNPSNYFSFARPDYGLLVAEAFKIAEDLKIYSYLYCMPKRLKNVYYERWKSNPYLPPTGRYEVSTLAEVPANTVPEEKWLARMIGQSKPYDVVINKRTLKEEFR